MKRWAGGMFHAVTRKRWLTALTVLIGVWLAFRGPQGIQSLIERHRQIGELEQQNAEKARQNDALRQRIQRLEDSGSKQELEIRKQLKLLRPGETTFLLPDPPKTSDAPAPVQ